jgi:hypothetical protein
MRIKLIVSVVVLLIWSNAFPQDANDKKAFTAATYEANRHGRCISVYPAKLHDNFLIFCVDASCKVR